MKESTRTTAQRKTRLAFQFLAVAWLGLLCGFPGYAVTIGYDTLNRIVRAEYDDGSVIEYSYDSAGNRTSKVIRANLHPVANAGSPQTVRLGSLVTLNGSGSSDPDNGPSPLSFTWSQTSGPSASLTGDKTVTPKFTPAIAGLYIFSLVVNDGKASSTPATVAITVPILGDIDGDGDVDSDDLAKINAALNTNANGPNDLRDLDGDGKITALDARKLVTLCTRPRCATK